MTAKKRLRVTLDLDDPDLYKAIRHAAIERDVPVRVIVVEALNKWLEELEAEEDIQDSAAAAEARKDAEPSMNLTDYARKRGWRV
ncbi:MAG: hypothetical protein Q7O66_00245 [Dehalococcoidia bacterium]|nr:hypothetical protein [Dehalococcoidia bacterium]